MRYVLSYFALMIGLSGLSLTLDHIAEGALMLESAEASCARRFGGTVPEELSAMLKLARQKLAEARAAIAAGAERPLDAVRLAQEVCVLARAVQLRV
jgi:hypothetical protein